MAGGPEDECTADPSKHQELQAQQQNIMPQKIRMLNFKFPCYENYKYGTLKTSTCIVLTFEILLVCEL